MTAPVSFYPDHRTWRKREERDKSESEKEMGVEYNLVVSFSSFPKS
jgi:hypothetical protein